jgi:hypothetical protein
MEKVVEFENKITDILREEKNMLTQANKFWQWLLTSSANQQQVSLTVKGWVTGALPMLAFVIHSPSLSSLPSDVYTVVFGVLGVVAAVQIVWGGLRKIWITLGGGSVSN